MTVSDEGIGSWTWRRGDGVNSSSDRVDLAGVWAQALTRVGHDLAVGQYGQAVDWVTWDVEHWGDGGMFLQVTVPWRGLSTSHGLAGFVTVDSSSAEIVAWAAEVTQETLGDIGIGWPHREVGGLLYARRGERAMWVSVEGLVVAVGSLTLECL